MDRTALIPVSIGGSTGSARSGSGLIRRQKNHVLGAAIHFGKAGVKEAGKTLPIPER
jgi:hypothetical protein